MKTVIGIVAGIAIVIGCFGTLIHYDNIERDEMAKQLTAIAVKMNCVPVEQSYRNPNKFYLYCGDGVYKAVDLSNHEELIK